MSVSNVYLFCSSTSPACVPCSQFVQTHRLPVETIRLETKHDRNRVMNGKNFQIKSVPSLMVLYDDGDMQLFVGQKKIISWMNRAIQPQEQPQEQIHEQPVPDFSDSEEEYVPEKKKKKKKKAKKHVETSKGLYGDTRIVPEEEEEIILIGEDESDRPSPPSTKGLMTGAQAIKTDTGMSDTMKMAKQMERDRTGSLGYDESKLPKYS